MAGTNDVLNKDFSIAKTLQDYEEIIKLFKGNSTTPIFTLIPLTNNSKFNDKIVKLNYQLVALFKSKNINFIDLNKYIAPSGYLSNEYTIDGVHFTEAAYKLWARQIKQKIHNNLNERFSFFTQFNSFIT